MGKPRILTFDCYGTLIDWNGGISSALMAEGRRQGYAVEREAILAAYHEAEPKVQAAGYRTYREVLTLLEAQLAAELGWQPPQTPGYLAAGLPDWPPFADTNRCLERLAGLGYELGILSNIDDDLLAGTRRHLTVDFALLVTAEQVRSYKPARPHFDAALPTLDGDSSRLLHIAQSYFHDIRPASELGFATVWVNRLAEAAPPAGPLPTAEVADLDGAVAWLLARYGGD